MSIEKVRAYFRPLGREEDIWEFPVSSATVELAAQAVGVIPARIAKTLSFLVEESCVLIVAAGDAKIDNSRYKAMFHTKAKMLTPEQVSAFTGHAVGGMLETPMTSMEMPAREMGEKAARMVIDTIEASSDAKPSVQRLVFPASLVVREST